MFYLQNINPQNFDHGTGYLVNAGKYWLGDPSLFLNEKIYKSLLEAKFMSNEDYCAGYLNDRMVMAMRTAYGDGVYYDNENNSYQVDSGMIGLLPVALRDDFATVSLGRFVEFREPMIFTKNNAGTFQLGLNGKYITIITDNL